MNEQQRRQIREDFERTVRQLGELRVMNDMNREELDHEKLERANPNSLYNTIERGDVETAINIINNGINVRPYHFNLALDSGSSELALTILDRQDFEPNNDQLSRAIRDGLSDVAIGILNKGVVPTSDDLRDALTNGLDEVALAIMSTGKVELKEFHVEAAVEGKLMGIAEDIYKNNPAIKDTLNDLAPASLSKDVNNFLDYMRLQEIVNSNTDGERLEDLIIPQNIRESEQAGIIVNAMKNFTRDPLINKPNPRTSRSRGIH